VTQHLTDPLERLRPHLAEAVARLGDRSPYASAWASSRRGLTISVDRQEEQIVEEDPASGVVLTAFDGETIRERSIGSLQTNPVLAEASAMAAALPAPAAAELQVNNGFDGRHDFSPSTQVNPSSMSLSEKVDRCRELETRLRGIDPRVINARVLYFERTDASVFRDRQVDLAQTIFRLRLVVMVFVRQHENVRYDWLRRSASGGWEAVQFDDADADALVESALRLLEAERIDPGEYEVVTSPGVTGVICHESFGHGVEMDMFAKGRARAESYLNRVVASPLVDIFDDPTYPGGYGSYFFDDEGMPAKRTQIVEKGVFRSGISDLSSAMALKTARTANGRRQDYSRKAYARMSNTHFGPGTSNLEELLAAAGDGVYLEKWSSGMEDPQGWGIQVTCHKGRQIKNGRLTNRYFAPIAIAGYVPDVLGTVRGVGDIVSMEGGTCGKGHKENVPVSSGGPPMWLRAKLG
jgi:TldD protein